MLIRPLLAGLVVGLVVAAACSAAPSEPAPIVQSPAVEAAGEVDTPITETASPTPTASPPPTRPSATAATAAPLAPAPPYEPVAGDVHPNAKRLAGAIAQQVTTYEPADTPESVAARVASERATALGAVIAPLVEPGAESVGRVIYPQLGGVTPSASSVMVVTEQRLRRPDGSESVVTRTLDVRLRLAGGEWAFDELASVGGEPVSRPEVVDPLVAAVLDDPRITLPDSARWDILSGQTDPTVLQAMLDMAERYDYAVTVLASGHPLNVFATDRLSNHTGGRAVDVYAIDGQLVALQHAEGSPAHQLARWLYETGVGELGSPWRFGGGSFTDVVHADHLHIGFRGR